MALLLFILIIWLMFYLAKKGEVYREEKRNTHRQATKKRKMTEEEIDELITVIIPTIKNDK